MSLGFRVCHVCQGSFVSGSVGLGGLGSGLVGLGCVIIWPGLDAVGGARNGVDGACALPLISQIVRQLSYKDCYS